MLASARVALELSKEGRDFLDLAGQVSDSELGDELIAAGARLLSVVASGKESILPAPAASDLKLTFLCIKALSFINPRGRFDLSFSRNALFLSNAKGSIVIPTAQLTHVAILDQIPQDTKRRCLLFLVLDRFGPAVMNGKQRLEVVIIQTLETDTANVTSTSGEILEGPMAAVVCQAVGMSIPNFNNFLVPDLDKYKSARGQGAVAAVVKVNPGYLFPLPGALLFTERPAIFVSHPDILAVEYRRTQSSTFDLVLHTRAPGAAGGSGASGVGIQYVEFSQIDRAELNRLQSYFTVNKIKVFDPAAPPRQGIAGGSETAPSRGGEVAGAAESSQEAAGGEIVDHDEDEDEDDDDFDPRELERVEIGNRPTKRIRTDPSGSGAGTSTAGSRNVAMAKVGTGALAEDEDEVEEEEEEDSDGSDDDDEDELADLTDEDDLRADDVRQRVLRGRGAAGEGHKKRPRSTEIMEEEEEEEYDGDDDD